MAEQIRIAYILWKSIVGAQYYHMHVWGLKTTLSKIKSILPLGYMQWFSNIVPDTRRFKLGPPEYCPLF